MERYHIFKLGLAILFYAAYCIRPMAVNGQKTDEIDDQPVKFKEEELVFYQGVEGKPGVDFPVLSHIPRTSFNCRDVDSGYYADLETDCQVFHICEENKKISFLCPNGTIFQQSELICEWWFKVNCTNSPSLYEESAEQLREDNARRKLSRRVQNHGAVMRMEERSSITVKNSNKASKRVYLDNFRENRINNHAPNYRDDVLQNDLSKSASSDFRDHNNGNEEQKEDENRSSTFLKQNQRGRKPIQFQQPAKVDNEEKRTTSPKTSSSSRRKVVNRQGGLRSNTFFSKNENVRNNNRNNYSSLEPNFDDKRSGFTSTQIPQTFRRNNVRFKQSTSFGSKTRGFDSSFNRNEFKSDSNSRNNNAFDSNKFKDQENIEEESVSGSLSSNRFKFRNEEDNREGSVSRNNDDLFNSNSFGFENQENNRERLAGSNIRKNDNSLSNSNSFGFANQENNGEGSINTNIRNNDSPFNSNSFGFEKQENNREKSVDSDIRNNGGPFNSNSFGTVIKKEESVESNSNNNDDTFNGFGNKENYKGTFNSKSFDLGNQENNEESFDTSFNNDNKEVFSNNQNFRHPAPFSTTTTTTTTPTAITTRQFVSRNEKINNYRQESSVPTRQPKTTTSISSSTQFNNNDFGPIKENHFNSYGINDDQNSFPNSRENDEIVDCQHQGNEEVDSFKQSRVTTAAHKPTPLSINIEQLDKNSKQNQKSNSFTAVFPNIKEEGAFNTGVRQRKTEEHKDGVAKQKNTASLTKYDIVSKKLEANDSDEAQITQETASFYKNSFNRIDQDKKSVANPYSNHRETYSELQEPKSLSTKIFSGISSVTPQYLTTQSINNGRPFVGSQVGTTFKKQTVSTTATYFTITTPTPVTVSKTGRAFNVFSAESTPTNLFNVGRTDTTLRPFSTISTFVPKPAANVTIPSQGSFNVGKSTLRPKIESSTGRIFDHATVYGKFVKDSPTTPGQKSKVLTTPGHFNISTTTSPSRSTIFLSKSLYAGLTTPKINVTNTVSPTKKTILLSKSLFGATPTPFSKSTGTVKTSDEVLSVADSFNRGTPQVRFFGKVQSTTKIPGVEIKFNGNSINAISTTAKPFSKSSSFISSSAVPLSVNSLTTTIPFSASTFRPEFNSIAPTIELNSITPSNFDLSTIEPNFTTRKSFGTTNTPQKKIGFFVTKNSESTPTQKSLIGEIIRPRPFQLPPEPSFSEKPVYTSPATENIGTTPTPTYPTYKISSASPFAEPSTPEPTQPTPFTTATSTLSSTFENVDSMINALAEMATHNNFTESSRPGLVIPPSAGPQTLHTLAVYFANALDGIASDKEEEEEIGEEAGEENLTKVELEKKRLTELLTQMTMDRYNELFNEEKEEPETTTVTSRSGTDDDLEGQHSKGPAQATPKVRQLAKVFTQALSSYLDDPGTFKKVLEEVRPTEPPALENEETIDFGDDELLNFSDADSKSSFPPFFPTPSGVRPTWGYLIAYNTSDNLDVKNSLNQERENLQGADSQSFVSQFNKLNKDKESTTKSSIQLPEDHWTTSPDVDKLWKSTFSINPASINENFEITEGTVTGTEEGTEGFEKNEEVTEEHHEIKYELKALPHLELNSTQVHGILIDFMNTTKNDDSNRLQRILRKLNTTEGEFLEKMKEIEGNPLTRRLILLLINECGNSTQQVDAKAVPVHSLLKSVGNNAEILQASSSIGGLGVRVRSNEKNSSDLEIVDPSLAEDSQDVRALQLLNSLYTIASKFGK